MSLIKSVLDTVLSRFYSITIVFIATAYFANMLSPNLIGIFFLFQAVLGILSIPADMGIRGAVTKRISEGKEKSRIFSTAIILKTALLTIISIITLFASSSLDSYIGMKVTDLIIVGLWEMEIFSLFRNVLYGEARVSEAAYLDIAQQTLWVISSLMLFYVGYRYQALIYAIIISYGILIPIGYLRIRCGFCLPNYESIQSIVDFSKYNFIAGLGGRIFNWVDTLILGLFLGNTMVAGYEVAWRLTTPILILASSISLAIFPEISHLHSSGMTKKIEKLVSQAMYPALAITIPAVVGSYLLKEDLIRFIFGFDYVFAASALTILVGSTTIRAVDMILSRILEGIDSPKGGAIGTATGAVSNIILNVVLIQAVGIEGAAIATTLAFIISTLVKYGLVRETIAINIESTPLLWVIVSSVIMGTGVFIIKELYGVQSIFGLLCAVISGILLYSGIMSINSTIRRDIWSVYSDIKS